MDPMRHLPRGIVTFLFTDVEGSTRLLHELGAEAYAESLARHRAVIREAVANEDGVEVDTQGDAFFIAFSDADCAARAAATIARSLGDGPIRVRIGLHTGRPLLEDDGYIGEDVHLGARIGASAHGGQVVISQTTRDALRDAIEMFDLGEHRLKDIEGPVPIYQMGSDAFPPLRTISNTNLPRPPDLFFGRDRELQEIAERVHARRRLLTLLGPGGTGKTRLANEAAATLIGDFKAGVFWVDLSSVREPAAVVSAVAATLGTEQDLDVHIGAREMLLVLDNLEQVIEAAPRIGSLVTECANLWIIVTSRERLRVRGESVLEVPPLGGQEATRLFADRSGLGASDEITELCERLENLPLAVELAAARTVALTPVQILERLSGRLDMLKGGRDADPRQRTLRATIEWSHGLLDASEQRLFRRLSVFAGGATLEAVEAVCGSDLDTVESLIDKSLIRFAMGRYSMLETVREYAAEQLEAAGERSGQRSRQADWVRTVMSARIPGLAAGGDDELARSLSSEFGNLEVAFAWLIECGDAAGAAAFIDTVWWFVADFLSQNRAGLAMCDAVVAMPGLTDGDRALVRHREGNFAVQLSDRGRAREAWTDAAALAHHVGDASREGNAIHNLALIATDPAEAVRLMESSMALRPPGDEREWFQAQWNLAGLKRRAGESATTEAMTADVLAWAQRVGDYQYMSAGEREMGELALEHGNAADGIQRATRSRDLAASRGHALAEMLAETLVARASIRLGRNDDAVAALGRTMDLLRHGDLESDDELAQGALHAAVEVMGGFGAVELAAQLEAVRSHMAQHLPPPLADIERSHDEWLTATGVVRATEATGIDTQSALDMVREWLAQSAGKADDG